ncbi:acetate uptake transporter [Brachyspira hyodysenteriae]|uniref:acetate uptake transporter n=1 Tax=Brachyspira hyodysenteriae TaxID=159 RepID=UPI0022CD88D9|nr:acetate uptake transporter [Brachyspira hyodysenteriae]MCZ9838911.1 acetate uptake transporter [Brachyspira hyodysenteriae]MCZ9848199.1 acetate uptake transporter [Brachyspira hyodysenteriae]MCZ9851753.1 acetate uptake transporter [Brachyspira hyodysenteriae]MCZ9859509.1 acetate uptake transporter [Brachyspira hyodysenteriae]MCZ9870113.1 acetate uptake transporter [Brachyspira hyodysenteriae]
MNNEVKVTHTLADPSPYGLFGLAVITFVASTQKLGITTGVSGLIPWAIFLGCIPQFVAAIVDFKKDNVFGATVFGAFGVFWFAVAFIWLISMGVFGEAMKSSLDMRQFGVVCIGYFFLVGALTFGAAEAHKVLFFIFLAVDVLLVAMALNYLGIAPKETQLIAGIAEFVTALIGFYGCAAGVLNKNLGRVVLPVGKPLGIFKK